MTMSSIEEKWTSEGPDRSSSSSGSYARAGFNGNSGSFPLMDQIVQISTVAMLSQTHDGARTRPAELDTCKGGMRRKAKS